jgi:hypothetical protein
MHTLPYIIDPKFLPKYWKTEHTSNYLTVHQLNLIKKSRITNKSNQIKNPFSQYKIC